MVMSVEIVGTNGDAKRRRADMHQRDEFVGQVVYTDNLLVHEQFSTLALNPTLGFEMAIDASFGGTPEPVHNGTDSVEWTGSNISGSKVTFDSTDQAKTGTKSVKVNAPAVNNVWQFDQGSTFTPANYVALGVWVYVDSNWTSGDSVEIYGWDTGALSEVGDRVMLENYINISDFGVWQRAVIPLGDFNFNGGTFEALRMEFVSKNGPAPLFYLDDIQFEQTGGSEVFKIEASKGHVFNVKKVTVTFIGPHASALVNNSLPNLTYNKLLDNAALSNGMVLSRVQKGVVAFAAALTNLSDFVRFGGEIKLPIVGDGTNSILAVDIIFDEPVPLDSRFEDNLNFTISDDLSSFVSITVLARGRRRNIGNGTVDNE